MHRKGLPCGWVSAVRHTGGERELSQSDSRWFTPRQGQEGEGAGETGSTHSRCPLCARLCAGPRSSLVLTGLDKVTA